MDLSEMDQMTRISDVEDAMKFVNTPWCETMCDALDLPYEKLRENAMDLYRRFIADPINQDFRIPRYVKKDVPQLGIIREFIEA
jgi:hypothetical protein